MNLKNSENTHVKRWSVGFDGSDSVKHVKTEEVINLVAIQFFDGLALKKFFIGRHVNFLESRNEQ